MGQDIQAQADDVGGGIPTCPRWAGRLGLCSAAVQGGCPGAVACNLTTKRQVREADAELKMRKLNGEHPDTWATTPEDYEEWERSIPEGPPETVGNKDGE